MKQFAITLKNEKRKSYQTSLLVIVLLNLLAFLLLAFTAKDQPFQNKALIAGGCILLFLVLDFFFRKKKKFDARAAAIAISVYFYLRMHLYWPAIAVILVALLFVIAMRNLTIRFTYDQIRFPSFPQRNIQWQELNNVLLKDGLLTMDFRNNKLVQQYIDPGQNDIDEKEFNDFCKEQLKPAASAG